MSKCEDIRPLLAELVYGEVDPDATEMVKEHLGSCLPCRRYQMAFEAVREDLQEWTPAAADGSRGITFITPAAHARPSIFSRPAVRGLAVAASFVLGVFLMAAAVNLQIHSNASGWSVSTSLWSTPAPAVEPASVGSLPQQEAATAIPQAGRANTVPPTLTDSGQPPARRVGFEQLEPELETWLDSQLDTRGVVHQSGLPSFDQLTPSQQREVLRMVADELAQSESLYGVYIHDEISASERRVMEQVVATIATLYQSMEAENDDELYLLRSELAVMHFGTDQQLQQAHERIDQLMALVRAREREEQ